ncbi:MAG: VOC family protein [Proteobacteria bacterium]|nr:VOC family protein [Pseudomonadota bacterium]
MEQRLSLITLGVQDIAAARAFYERLGWCASPPSNEAVAFFQLGGMILGLYGRDALAADAGLPAEGTGFRGVALAYNARDKAGVDAALETARKAGATIVKPAETVFWGGYSGYFADPDGHLWEVAWNTGFPIDDAGNISLPKG